MSAPVYDSAFPAAPILLGLETAGSLCSAAVARGGAVLAGESRPLRHGHGEVLMPMIDRVMARAAVAPGELDIVAVTIGPGGFTGIRVGLAAARGIALATGARLIGVSGFAAVAQAFRRDPPPIGQRAALLVALESRREDLYVQLLALPSATPLASPLAILPDRLAGYVDAVAGGQPLLIAGDAAQTAAAALQDSFDVEMVPDSAPDALGVLAAALAAARSGASDEPVRPLYLRPPDVTMPKSRRAAAAARG